MRECKIIPQTKLDKYDRQSNRSSELYRTLFILVANLGAIIVRPGCCCYSRVRVGVITKLNALTPIYLFIDIFIHLFIYLVAYSLILFQTE